MPISTSTIYLYSLYTVAGNDKEQPDRLQRLFLIGQGRASDASIQQMAKEAAQQQADAIGLPIGVWLEQRPNDVDRFLEDIISQELIVVCQPAVPYWQW